MMSETTKKKEAIPWGHRDLIDDLGNHLGDAEQVLLKEVAAGSRWYQNAPIPDLMLLNKSYSRTDVRIYEIKVSRADLRHDILSHKWREYLPFCDAFFFAVPTELADVAKEMLKQHPEAGLTIRGEKGWRTFRRGNKKPREEQPEMFWMALLFASTRPYQELREERTKLENSKEYLKELRAAEKKIEDTAYVRLPKALAKMADELRGRETKLQIGESNLEAKRKHIGASIYRALRGKLGLHMWSEEGIGDLMKDAVFRPAIEEAEKRFAKLTEALKDEIAADVVKETDGKEAKDKTH